MERRRHCIIIRNLGSIHRIVHSTQNNGTYSIVKLCLTNLVAHKCGKSSQSSCRSHTLGSIHTSRSFLGDDHHGGWGNDDCDHHNGRDDFGKGKRCELSVLCKVAPLKEVVSNRHSSCADFSIIINRNLNINCTTFLYLRGKVYLELHGQILRIVEFSVMMENVNFCRRCLFSSASKLKANVIFFNQCGAGPGFEALKMFTTAPVAFAGAFSQPP